MRLALKRLFAYWIDFVILGTVLIGLQLLVYKIASGFPFDVFDEGYEIELWVLGTMSLPVWGYFIYFESRKQQTLGKKWLGLRVINAHGNPISLRQAILRTAVRLLPWELTHWIVLVPEPWWNTQTPGNQSWIYLPNGILLLYLVIIFSAKGSLACHDHVARTRVTEMD
ncbi:RDD family protein [Paenibacillus macerans]|uniref:RDD family protein n=1 Tax=Paenibacillus macerans TaxID=44252 RepID=UPI003D314C27